MNYFLKTVISILVAIAICTVIFGVLYATVPAVKEWTQNTFNANEEPAEVEADSLPYKFRYNDAMWMIEGYTGEETVLTLPETFSYKEIDQNYTFNNLEELLEYTEEIRMNIMSSPDFDHGTDFDIEQFNLVFIYADKTEIVCKSLRDLDEKLVLPLGRIENAFPITHLGKKRLYVSGNDYEVTAVDCLSDTVEVVNIPTNYEEVNIRYLGKNVKEINFPKDNKIYGTYENMDGTLVDTATQKLIYVYPDTIKGTEYTTSSYIEQVDFTAFHAYLNYDLENQTLSKVIINEGVTQVSNLNNVYVKTDFTLELPYSLQTIEAIGEGVMWGAENACSFSRIIFKSIPEATINNYIYCFDSCPTYIFVDEVYEQLILQHPEYAQDEQYLTYVKKYSDFYGHAYGE